MIKSRNRIFISYTGLRNLPNVILCLSIGFLGVLFFKNAYLEIKVIENEDIFFQSAKIVLGFSLILGILFKRFFDEKKALYIEYSVILLLIAEMVTLNGFSSGLLQVDYIFYTDVFLFFASLNCFATGMLAARLKNFRLWGFLSGGISFIVYSYLNPDIVIKPEIYILPLIFVLILELCLYSIIPKSSQEIPKSIQKTYSINNIYFYSALSLLICHFIIYLFNIKEPDSFIIGSGLGLLIFNFIFQIGILNSLIKWKFLFGRGILIVSLILTMHESRFELASGVLLFLDTACIAIYRPEKINKKAIFFSIFAGILLYFLTYLLNIYYLRLEFRYLLVFGFVVLTWIPFIFIKSIKLINKAVTILISFGLAAYFFSPLPYDYKMNFIKTESLKPIPFLLTSISLNEEDFVYFNINLPFKNQETLPKKNSFKNKTIVLGLGDNLEITLTYLFHLNKNGYPFIIFQDKNARALTNNLIEFDSIEYPLYRIYFPKNSIPVLQKEKEKIETGLSWEALHIEGRLKGLETNEDIVGVITNLMSYSSGTLNETTLQYRNKLYNSYKMYAEYYYETGEYDRAILMSGLAFSLNLQDEVLLDTAYNSLLRITTEKDQISVMNILLSKNKYKEQVIKRLYPLLLTLNRKEEALEKINELVDFYAKDSQAYSEELKNLRIEKAKIYLQFSNIREAEEIILTETRKNANSVIWQKLLADLISLKESNQRVYSNSPVNPNSNPRSIQ